MGRKSRLKKENRIAKAAGLIIVSKPTRARVKPKCIFCKVERKGLDPNDGWIYHYDVFACPKCKMGDGTKVGAAAAQSIVVGRGDLNRQNLVEQSGSKDYEQWECRMCGAPAGRDCQQDCEAQIENNEAARREVLGGGQYYDRNAARRSIARNGRRRRRRA